MSIKAYTVAAVIAAGVLGFASTAGAQMRPTGIVPTPTYYNARPTYNNPGQATFYNTQPTYYNSQATYYNTGWNYAPSVPVGAVATGTSAYTTPYATYSPLGTTSTPVTSSAPFQLLTPQQPVQLPSTQLPLNGQPVQLPSTQFNLSSGTNLPSVAASGVMTGTPAWSTLPSTGATTNTLGTYSRSPYTAGTYSGSYSTGSFMPLSSGMHSAPTYNSPLYTNPARTTTGNLGYTPLWSTGYYSQYGWHQ